MPHPIRRARQILRGERPATGVGAIAAALILSSCSAVGLSEDGELASQPAPLPDPAELAGSDQPVGQPLQLVPSNAFDWVDEAMPQSVVTRTGAESVGSIWAGLPLNTEPLALAMMPDHAEPPAGGLPLLVAEGRYHYPESIDADETPCLRSTGPDLEHVRCAAWDDQIAMAPQTVDDSMLEEQRGGFITVSGFQIDIGIQVETLVNGVTQLTTALTLDDVVNGGLEGIQIGQLTIGNGSGGTTDIIHNVELGNVNTVINNSQDDIDISTLATLAIDVINLQQPQVGNSFGASGRMAPELQQSIIRGINR